MSSRPHAPFNLVMLRGLPIFVLFWTCLFANQRETPLDRAVWHRGEAAVRHAKATGVGRVSSFDTTRVGLFARRRVGVRLRFAAPGRASQSRSSCQRVRGANALRGEYRGPGPSRSARIFGCATVGSTSAITRWSCRVGQTPSGGASHHGSAWPTVGGMRRLKASDPPYNSGRTPRFNRARPRRRDSPRARGSARATAPGSRRTTGPPASRRPRTSPRRASCGPGRARSDARCRGSSASA